MSRYGSRNAAGGGEVAVPFACPVVVVRLYTKPGCSVTVKLPPAGVTSGSWMKLTDGSVRLVAQTCTVPVEAPPVSVNVAVCGAVAVVVSITDDQSDPLGDTRLTKLPLARAPSR